MGKDMREQNAQPVVEAVSAQLLAPERLRALRGAHRGWARALAVLLAAARQLPDQAQRLPPDWDAQLREALLEALRCSWSWLPCFEQYPARPASCMHSVLFTLRQSAGSWPSRGSDLFLLPCVSDACACGSLLASASCMHVPK
jgi:hypothetical protein